MKEQLEQYVKRIRERYQDCLGNESATKASLIAPLFVILGYDMADPRECKPEYRTDFGKGEKAATPVDWAFLIDGTFAFFVEAKEAGAKITRYAEQLGMYFAKEPAVKLGILTNGVEWKFFTDLDHLNVMDREPFLTWNLLEADPIPLDFLTLLHKSQFKQQLFRAFAETKRRRSLLVDGLTRLLEEPSPEFVRLAVQKVNEKLDIETRSLTPKVIAEWKPIVANAIQDWAKRYTLAMALERPTGERPPSADKPQVATSRAMAHGVALTDLIAAGILTPPLKLFRKYKGQMVEAELRPDGQIVYQGVNYTTPSRAAKKAAQREHGVGGWTFWQYRDPTGKRACLDDARKKFLKTEKGLPKPADQQGQHERYGLRKRFWQGLLSRPGVKNTPHADIAPHEYSWIAAGSGVRGLPFTFTIRQEEGEAALYIVRGTGMAAENKEIFDRLQKHKEEIEKAFGGELSWQRLDDKQACRVAYVVAGGGYRSEESRWPEIQDAMIEAMIRLEKAFAPHLASLKTELTSDGP
jgi:hypothetical protein